MRNLMAKSFARIERRVPSEFWGEITLDTPRRNFLALTDKARAAAKGYTLFDAEMTNLRSAFYHGVARSSGMPKSTRPIFGNVPR